MDFARLRLAAKGDAVELNRILQLELRHKHAVKLHHTLACPEFEFPDSLAAEQSTGDDLAECHALLIAEGDRVLDMTCGLGIDAFHIARRAAHVTACEMKPHVARMAARNARALGLGNIEVIEGDSVEWLAGNDRTFDVIFIDPARRSAGGGRLYALADCVPDVTALLPMLRERAPRLVIKASPMLDVSRTVAELGGEADILLLGTPAECKELVAVLPGTGEIRAVTTGCGDFSFTREQEAGADPEWGRPVAGEWIHEPFPSVMKSGARKLLAVRYRLAKIAPDTHLYVGPPRSEFPGKRYRIVAVEPFDKRGIRSMLEKAPEGAEIAVRNFGLGADALRARLKMAENPSVRIYGVRDADSRRLLVLTVKE